MQGPLLCKYFTKSHQSKFKFSHSCAARLVCKHYVRLICRTTPGKGRKWMRLEVGKEIPIFYTEEVHRECKLLNLKIFCFNCVVCLVENLENLLKGKMFDWTI